MQVYLPTNDLLFKKLLTSEDSQHILKAFVKDLLGLEFERLMPKQTYHIDSYKKSYEERDEILDILREYTEDEEHTILISSHITSDLDRFPIILRFFMKDDCSL